jgi:colanic acid/amylovoran biosynthesis glycosyltransferase
MRIAYLVPEFPGQTHAFFWRERAALAQIGVTTMVVSTRRPPKALASHDWCKQAEADTVYMTDFKIRDVLWMGIHLIRCGPVGWLRAIKAAGCDCPPRKLCRNFGLILVALRLLAFMRAKKLSHVHSHSCADSALIAMLANRLGNITYSLTLHGELNDYGRQQMGKWRYAAFGITITSRLYHEMRRKLPDELLPRIGVAPMGVDPSIFRRGKPYAPWSGVGPLCLFSCGRLNYVKGHQDLIQAVKILRASGVDVRLKVAGEDESGGVGFHKELDKVIERLELTSTVALLGAVSERAVVRGLEEAHLFVLASHHEPLGVAIMEAMSCETPVIATNRGGVPELIDNGLNGLLMPAGNPEEIAKSIMYLANNPGLARALSRCGRAKILRSFNSTVSAVELKRLLRECVQSPPSSVVG